MLAPYVESHDQLGAAHLQACFYASPAFGLPHSALGYEPAGRRTLAMPSGGIT
jgi:hypothetical protein